MYGKSNTLQSKSFSLNTPLKSARKMLGFEREVTKKYKYPEDTPEYLRAGEFPAVNLENDPITKIATQL